ncbi:hypothetical protein N7537_008031 [Penicillium hordei]|uniref:Uncharacterized protein n=1 Tax=Penicillium hordei TaxID=40994 RepID=A0AAD6GZ65_9EURO|nr:uncharacterized protein N7537_008031 [Penicillium hordei]KAJ5597947.1 hypothetical protein N7537_008031 [Penicillium hordei]
MLQAENDEEVATFIIKPNKYQNEEKIPNVDIDAEMAKLIDVKNHPTGELRESLGYGPVIMLLSCLVPSIDEVALCDSIDCGD